MVRLVLVLNDDNAVEREPLLSVQQVSTYLSSYVFSTAVDGQNLMSAYLFVVRL